MRMENSRCRLLSFSGMDGAGKGTQIEALCEALQQADQRVLVVRFWDDVACLKRLRETTGHKVFKGDKGIGSPEVPINRRDKNVQTWPMNWLRLGLYLLDALSLRRVVRRTLRSGTDFVICDRYIYDELANLNLRKATVRAYIRAILKIVPRPDVSYVLDADPVAARARKPEYPIDFLYINQAAYYTLADLTGTLTVIPPMSIEEARCQVRIRAMHLLPQVPLQARGEPRLAL